MGAFNELLPGTLDMLILRTLQRGSKHGWVTAEWGTSENNRHARYYTLTAAGRKHLASETREYDRMIGTIRQAMENA